jgi:hypothetical protein
MAFDGQFAKDLKACSSEIQGTAICHFDGKCSICPFAERYENPTKFIDIYQKIKEIKEVN